MISTGFPQVYIWRDGSDLTMFDAGFPGDEPALSEAFDALGYAKSALRRLVLTHHHEDHSGAAAAVRAWGDVEVVAHRLDAPVVRGEQAPGERQLTPEERALFEKLSADTPPAPHCAVDTEVGDGDTINIGGGAEVISGAGHTAGSIGIFIRAPGILFTGDLIVNSAVGPTLGKFNEDNDLARRSFVTMAARPAEIVCFGHGEPLIDAVAWAELNARVNGDPANVPTG